MSGSIEGRWDLMVGDGDGAYPSWLEIAGASSRFVGRVGSARPIPSITVGADHVSFRLPKQYESRTDDLVFEGQLQGYLLVGTTTLEDGSPTAWRGVRAPDLKREGAPNWGPTQELIGPDLAGWTARSDDMPNNWRAVDGMLVNDAVGSDLVTVDRFMDFKLVAEYKYPPGSNSGIYLRGRYEFQILDDFGHAPGVGTSGAIYGFIKPTSNAVQPADEWNVAEITLLGRLVTVVLNGETVVDAGEIPGITGGALDCDEGVPGPLFLQGDHGPVVFRRLSLTPAV